MSTGGSGSGGAGGGSGTTSWSLGDAILWVIAGLALLWIGYMTWGGGAAAKGYEINYILVFLSIGAVIGGFLGTYYLIRRADSSSGHFGDQYEGYALLVYTGVCLWICIALVPTEYLIEAHNTLSPFKKKFLAKPDMRANAVDEVGNETKIVVPKAVSTDPNDQAESVFIQLEVNPDIAESGLIVPKAERRHVWIRTKGGKESRTEEF